MVDPVVVAVDLGTSSGRVMLGRVGPGRLEPHEVHRFGNAPVPLPTGWHWDALGLFREVLTGPRAAGRALVAGEQVVSIGLPDGLLPPLRHPGDHLGTLLPHVAQACGLPRATPVTAVGSHDTASAVVAGPAETDRFA